VKLFIQLIFFGLALLLTFFAIFIWFLVYASSSDSTPQGLLQLNENDWMNAIVLGFVYLIIAIIISLAFGRLTFSHVINNISFFISYVG
tara:strand:+ start:310 stop:576 length:267 start_codon:yes stop_codon:yes gene_type:complete